MTWAYACGSFLFSVAIQIWIRLFAYNWIYASVVCLRKMLQVLDEHSQGYWKVYNVCRRILTVSLWYNNKDYRNKSNGITALCTRKHTFLHCKRASSFIFYKVNFSMAQFYWFIIRLGSSQSSKLQKTRKFSSIGYWSVILTCKLLRNIHLFDLTDFFIVLNTN